MKERIEIRHNAGMTWAPVRVKAKREKKLAEYCKANSVNCYLPLRRSLKRYDRRTFEFFVPMFPGYVFCQLDESTLKSIRKSDGFFQKIDVDEVIEKKLIEELNDIQKIEEASVAGEVEVCPEIISGKKVKVCGGPLSGVSGYVEKRKDKLLVSVNVEILGQSVTVALDVGDIELEDK